MGSGSKEEIKCKGGKNGEIERTVAGRGRKHGGKGTLKAKHWVKELSWAGTHAASSLLHAGTERAIRFGRYHSHRQLCVTVCELHSCKKNTLPVFFLYFIHLQYKPPAIKVE